MMESITVICTMKQQKQIIHKYEKLYSNRIKRLIGYAKGEIKIGNIIK
jgi:hypothetical protein